MDRDPILQELQAAEEFLNESQVVYHSGSLRSAFSRLYDAIFHAAKAALLVDDRRPKTHDGLLNQLGAAFRNAEWFDPAFFDLVSTARAVREFADYGFNEPETFTDEGFEALHAEAAEFIATVRTHVVASGIEEARRDPTRPKAGRTRRHRKCDERCRMAATPASTCECECGGKNHGIDQTRSRNRRRAP